MNSFVEFIELLDLEVKGQGSAKVIKENMALYDR
jgi:hypothetical protein